MPISFSTCSTLSPRRIAASGSGIAAALIFGIGAILVGCGESPEPTLQHGAQAVTGSNEFHASPNPCALGAGDTSCQTTLHWPSKFPPSSWSKVWLWRSDAGQPDELVGCYPASRWGSVEVDVEAAGTTFTLGARHSCDPKTQGAILFLGSLSVTPVQCAPGDELHPQVPAQVVVDDLAPMVEPGCPGIDEQRVRWSFSDVPVTANGLNVPKYYGERGTHTVTIDLFDPSLTDIIETEIFSVTATFAPPVLSAYEDRSWDTARDFALPMNLTSPARAGNLDLTVDWGDGSPVESLAIPEGTDYSLLAHRFSTPNVYTVTVTIEDEDAQSDAQTFDLTITNSDFVDLHVEFPATVVPGMKTYGRFVASGGLNNETLIDTALSGAPGWMTILPDEPNASSILAGTIEATVPIGATGPQSFDLVADDGSLTDTATVDFIVGTYSEEAPGQLITAAGGTVEVTNPRSPIYGAKLVVPAGSLAQDQTISIGTVTPGPSNTPSDAFAMVEVQPSGLDFTIPASLHIPVNPEQLYSLASIQGAEIATYEPDFTAALSSRWVGIDTTVDAASNELIALLETSSPYRPRRASFWRTSVKTFSYMDYDVKYIQPDNPGEWHKHQPIDGSVVPTHIMSQLDSFDPSFTYDPNHSTYAQNIARIAAYSDAHFSTDFDCAHPGFGKTTIRLRVLRAFGAAHPRFGIFLRPNLLGQNWITPAHEVFHMCQFQAMASPANLIGQISRLVSIALNTRNLFILEAAAEAMALEALGWDSSLGKHDFLKDDPGSRQPTWTSTSRGIYHLGDSELRYEWFPFFRYLTNLPGTGSDPIRHYFSRTSQAIQDVGLGNAAEFDFYENFVASFLPTPLQTLAEFALHFQQTRNPSAIPGIDDWFSNFPGFANIVNETHTVSNPLVLDPKTWNAGGRSENEWAFLKAGASVAHSLWLPINPSFPVPLEDGNLVIRVEGDYRSTAESATAFLYEFDNATRATTYIHSFPVKDSPADDDLIRIPLCDIYDCAAPFAPRTDYAIAIVNDPAFANLQTPAQVKVEVYVDEVPEPGPTWMYFAQAGDIYRLSLDEAGVPAGSPELLYEVANPTALFRIAVDPDRGKIYWGGMAGGSSSLHDLWVGSMDGAGPASQFYQFSDFFEDGLRITDIKVSQAGCSDDPDRDEVWIYFSASSGGASPRVKRICSDGSKPETILTSWTNGDSPPGGGSKSLGIPTKCVMLGDGGMVVGDAGHQVLWNAPPAWFDRNDPNHPAVTISLDFRTLEDYTPLFHVNDCEYDFAGGQGSAYFDEISEHRLYRRDGADVETVLDTSTHDYYASVDFDIEPVGEFLYWAQHGLSGYTQGILRSDLEGEGVTVIYQAPDIKAMTVCTDCDWPIVP